MSETIHEFSLLLGKLDARIMHLSEDMARSFLGQQEVQRKLDNIAKEMLRAYEQLQSLERRVEKVEKPVAKMQIWQERGLGILSFICLASVFIGEAAKSFIEKLLSFLS